MKKKVLKNNFLTPKIPFNDPNGFKQHHCVTKLLITIQLQTLAKFHGLALALQQVHIKWLELTWQKGA
jgi:hypothetical protein